MFSNDFIRFIVNGSLFNSFCLLLYSLLSIFLNPILVVFILYPISALVGFILHKNLSFKFNTKYGYKYCLFKYIFALFIGFLINLFLLNMFLNTFSLNHIISQFISVLLVAVILFFINKYFVFVNNDNDIIHD